MAIDTVIEVYRKQLRRIAWRLQYKVRVQTKREVPILFDYGSNDCTASQMESRLFVNELIHSLPPSKGRTIIHDLYINEKTEAQIASQMNMSQQAVNKWKNKMLRILYQRISS